MIHVAERHQLGTAIGDVVQIPPALAANTDSRHSQFVVRFIRKCEFALAKDKQASPAPRRISKKVSPTKSGFHGSNHACAVENCPRSPSFNYRGTSVLSLPVILILTRILVSFPPKCSTPAGNVCEAVPAPV